MSRQLSVLETVKHYGALQCKHCKAMIVEEEGRLKVINGKPGCKCEVHSG